MSPAQAESQAVATVQPSDDQLRELTTLQDVAALFGPTVTDASDLGSGFALLKDADTLIGTPLMILSWNFNKGEFSDEFVSAHVVTVDLTDNKITGKYILNDGSTGVYNQLKNWPDNNPIAAKHGLRKSEYRYCETCGEVVKGDEHPHKTTPGATYYIDTSA